MDRTNVAIMIIASLLLVILQVSHFFEIRMLLLNTATANMAVESVFSYLASDKEPRKK